MFLKRHEEDEILRSSFCSKTQHDVDTLISNPSERSSLVYVRRVRRSLQCSFGRAPESERGHERPIPVSRSGVILALTTSTPGNRNFWPGASVMPWSGFPGLAGVWPARRRVRTQPPKAKLGPLGQDRRWLSRSGCCVTLFQKFVNGSSRGFG